MTTERVIRRPQHLLERDRELAEIDACIAAASTGQASFLVLEGRSGMGKSTLLAEVRRRAGEAGLEVCSARGSDLEDEFAFGVVRQLFEPAIAALGKPERAQVFEGAAALAEPVLNIGDEPAAGGQFAALHGLYWLAANLSAQAPLLLVVDDAHWADAASLRWLAYLLNRLDGLSIVVAIATRPPDAGPQGELLAAILAQPGIGILRLEALSEGSVAVLVLATLGADPEPIFTAACLRATAGTPLGLTELLRDLRTDGVAPTGAAAPHLETRAPDAIARRVRRDLTFLGDEAVRLASAVAVIGVGTDLRLIARLADLEVDRAAEVADGLESVDLILPERPLRFVHPLLRAAVYDRLSAGSQHKMHRKAAEILASEGAEPETVAAHLLRCEPGRSAQTVKWLRIAAPTALRRGAPETAVSYLGRALAEDADPATRPGLLAELARVELAAGDMAAIGHLREALAGTTERRARADILGDLALALILQGEERASRDLLDGALEGLDGGDLDAYGRVECIVSGLSSGDPRVASSPDNHYPRLRELALGDTPNAELARVTLASLVSWSGGDREEGLAWIGSGFDWKALFDDGYSHLFGVIWSILALLGIDESGRAVGWCDTVIREAAKEGYPPTVVTGMVHRAYAECRMGLLAEAEADATAALEMSRELFPYWVPVSSAWLAEILYERGQQQMAYDAIEGISIDRGLDGGPVEAAVREVRGRLRCARGWRERGVDDLRASGRLCEILRLRNPLVWSWQSSLATALSQDCPEEARHLALDNLANAQRSRIPRAIGIALRTLAGLDRDNSVELLRAAIVELHGLSAPLDLTRCLTDLGTALRRRGHRIEAREPLREALEIAAHCGAVPLMQRAHAEALAAGARPRRPRLRGVDALTPSELRVARLAAEGRANREIAQALFITTTTVADHLGRAYSKLNIASRGQLRSALGLAEV